MKQISIAYVPNAEKLFLFFIKTRWDPGKRPVWRWLNWSMYLRLNRWNMQWQKLLLVAAQNTPGGGHHVMRSLCIRFCGIDAESNACFITTSWRSCLTAATVSSTCGERRMHLKKSGVADQSVRNYIEMFRKRSASFKSSQTKSISASVVWLNMHKNVATTHKVASPGTMKAHERTSVNKIPIVDK